MDCANCYSKCRGQSDTDVCQAQKRLPCQSIKSIVERQAECQSGDARCRDARLPQYHTDHTVHVWHGMARSAFLRQAPPSTSEMCASMPDSAPWLVGLLPPKKFRMSRQTVHSDVSQTEPDNLRLNYHKHP